MKAFSERLKFEREQNGFTKRKMSELLGIPETTYGHYEATDKWNREPPFELVVEIAKILDVSIDYLFGLTI